MDGLQYYHNGYEQSMTPVRLYLYRGDCGGSSAYTKMSVLKPLNCSDEISTESKQCI